MSKSESKTKHNMNKTLNITPFSEVVIMFTMQTILV